LPEAGVKSIFSMKLDVPEFLPENVYVPCGTPASVRLTLYCRLLAPATLGAVEADGEVPAVWVGDGAVVGEDEDDGLTVAVGDAEGVGDSDSDGDEDLF
jgi:hypothetical protein